LYKEYKKIEKEYWTLCRQRDREEQAWIDELCDFNESVRDKLSQSFEELYQKKEEYVEQAQWLERYACGNVQRIHDRIAALEDIKSTGVQYAVQQYQLSPQAQDAIQKAGYRKLKYNRFVGNQLQRVIHQDCINLVEGIIIIPDKSIAHPYANALLTCTDSAREYNMLGDLRKAMDITDFCWSLIDHGKNLLAQAADAVANAAIEYGQAIGHGCIGGAVGAATGIAQEIYEHPWQTLASVVAGEAMFSFAIGKLIANVADIGITYCCIDVDKGVKKFEEFIQPITDLIAALTQAQQQGGAQAVQCVTHIATQLWAQALLFKGMTQFCDVLKSKALTFAKNNPLVSFDAYAQTSDGSVIKVSTENIRTQARRKSTHKPDCHCYDTQTCSPIREIVLPQVDTYSKAQKKAWEILGKVDQQTAIPYVGKKGVCKDKLIGMGWHNNKAVIRLDWDGVKGPHINVVDYRLNKGINGVSFAIPFKGSEKSLNKLLNHLNTEACLENARQFFKKTKNDVSLSKIEHTISELAKPRREREVIEICKRKY
jgi:hypothetical protein